MISQEEAQRLQELRDRATRGMDAEQFMESTLGRYITQRADQEVEEAVAALKSADPEDAKTIRALQTQIAVAERFRGWFSDLYTQGRNAEEVLRAEYSRLTNPGDDFHDYGQ